MKAGIFGRNVFLMGVLAIAAGLFVVVNHSEAQEQAEETRKVKRIEYLSSADNTMQPAMFYSPNVKEKRPLLVALHTWGGRYNSESNIKAYGGDQLAIQKGWVYIFPNFRGPNYRPEATGSELVVKDIISAVDYCKKNANVDEKRIYLMGCSGGGHASLIMAGRAPKIWAGVSAWVPIANLKTWYIESKAKKNQYAGMIARSCGGDPTTDPKAEAEAKKRSPVTYLKKARGVPLDINGGIGDTLVPCSHSLRAFNAVAKKKDRISDEDIEYFVANKKVPPKLEGTFDDPTRRRGSVLFRRQSGKARVTIFRGGHTIRLKAAIAWLEQQHKGKPRK